MKLRKGDVQVHSTGHPVSTFVQVWSGTEWVNLTGVQSIVLTAQVEKLNHVTLGLELVRCDVTIPAEMVREQVVPMLPLKEGSFW